MIISMIVAMDEQRGIGINNKLPWRLPEDTAFFKRTTIGHTVLMGRKTFESIGKPLPKRTNVVLTRDRSYRAEGCEMVYSVDEALERYRNGVPDDELFVIGGAEVYKLFMPHAAKLYVTEIAHRFGADTFFPEIDSSLWKVTNRQQGVKNESNPYDYEFVIYERLP
ncbi:dihydrofolate reductase [Paenibacillus xerothermodurans]|uniref:Dihydrofolate reductase n=1 Tax=Paenibacillus xerothermodurans TaxID=1977292 RepID=A0A2W1NSI5_PAEXE|nr:dihydrofolate reductase [Paenibacillus xerothermodurans]PZE20716.1 dihydrofolate reductase [Paenibacillus xerothermodurans]